MSDMGNRERKRKEQSYELATLVRLPPEERLYVLLPVIIVQLARRQSEFLCATFSFF